MPYQKTGKIVSIIFLVILLMSIFSIMLSHNDAGVIRKPDDFSDIDPTESEQEDNSIFSPIPEKEPATASPTSTPVIHSSTEYEIYNSNSYMNSRTSASRANETYDYDLRIERININYTGIFRWPVMNNDKIYFYYIAGEIGKPTNFSVTIKNIGKKNILNSDKVFLSLNLTDYFGHSSWEQKDYAGHILSGNELELTYTWIPKYSNRFNLTCNLSFNNDQNLSNNVFLVYNLFTTKWSDDLEDGVVDDWTGQVNSNAWHLTDNVKNDPNPYAHTSDYSFYNGKYDSVDDDYTEANDFDLITPEIDLRRFDDRYLALFGFRFYGDSTLGNDKLTFEGYKSSEEKWKEIDVEIPNPIKKHNESAWNMNTFIDYVGINIHDFVGEIARFKIHWHSDHLPEDLPGYYLDDFFVYGYELPIPDYDVGIESMSIKPKDATIAVGDKVQISVNITNNGERSATNFMVTAYISDFPGRPEPIFPKPYLLVDELGAGKSKTLTWIVSPSVSGLYFINVSVDFESDQVKHNDYIISEAIEVIKYYDPFENQNDDWSSEFAWVRTNVVNDPNPSAHSRIDAWYVGKENIDISDINTSLNLSDKISTSLYSPIIDLDGAQTNPIYDAQEIKIGFKWLDHASSSETIYFEYALDHTDDWTEFETISGENTDTWEPLVWVGTIDLFEQHIQFRWRFETDAELDAKSDSGFYIDDFSVWVIQEQYGRPIISECKVTPYSLINDSREQTEISCTIQSIDNSINEVLIDLSPIGGPEEQAMVFSSGYSEPTDNYYNEYNLTITVPPSKPAGEYILKLTAIDNAELFDHNYVKITVRENSAPKILKHAPVNSSIIITENEGLTGRRFSIEASDEEDGTDLQYDWYLDGLKIKDLTKNYYEFETNFYGENSAGDYSLRVVVSDFGLPSKTNFFEWSIKVLNVLPDFEIRDRDLELSKTNVTVNDNVTIYVAVRNLKPAIERNVTVYFIQQSTNISIGESVFEEYNFADFSNSIEYISLNWVANSSYNYIKVWVDKNNIIPEVSENNNFGIISINVSLPPVIIEPTENPSDDEKKSTGAPYILYLLLGVVVSTLLGTAAAIGIGTEFGNYKLFLMFGPLYSRVTGDKILEHKVRSRIYMHIRAHPGDHYRSIMATLKIKNGTLVHHLARLEQEELIKSERDGYYKRFYPVGMRIPKSEVGMYYPEGIPTYNIGEHQLSEIQMQMIKAIRTHPGLSQKDISMRIHESRRVVNYHIKLLEQHNLIRVTRNGRETQCYLISEVSST